MAVFNNVVLPLLSSNLIPIRLIIEPSNIGLSTERECAIFLQPMDLINISVSVKCLSRIGKVNDGPGLCFFSVRKMILYNTCVWAVSTTCFQAKPVKLGGPGLFIHINEYCYNNKPKQRPPQL